MSNETDDALRLALDSLESLGLMCNANAVRELMAERDRLRTDLSVRTGERNRALDERNALMTGCNDARNALDRVESERDSLRAQLAERRVVVPEITLDDAEQILRGFPADLPAWEGGNWAYAMEQVRRFLVSRARAIDPATEWKALAGAPHEHRGMKVSLRGVISRVSDYLDRKDQGGDAFQLREIQRHLCEVWRRRGKPGNAGQ